MLPIFISAFVGFISLSQEILWFRIISYMTQSRPVIFAHILTMFLLGVAVGAISCQKICERFRIPKLVFIQYAIALSALVYFISVPLTAEVIIRSKLLGLPFSYFMVFLVAGLLGGVFPLLCDMAGSVSSIYVANIVGSTIGPLFTGFIWMDLATFQTMSLQLSLLTLALSVGVGRKNYFATAGLGIILLVSHAPLYKNIMEKLQFKTIYHENKPFLYSFQNRGGTAMIADDGIHTIYGTGTYDGTVNVDYIKDTNGIFRTLMIAALHPDPQEVLEIGLSSASWTRVMSDFAAIKNLTVVEINSGYLEVIKNFPENAKILNDPKVNIQIDDARRWLNRNKHRKFDMIVMNTTQNFKSNLTNLLSKEFLELCKSHLNAGGVMYFNTTGSQDTIRTVAEVFNHVTTIHSFVAGSDSPFSQTLAQKRANFMRYMRDGKPFFANKDAKIQDRLNDLVNYDISDKGDFIRGQSSLRVITDNNMITEFKPSPTFFNSNMGWSSLFAKARAEF
jgi:spermidine synthase